MIQIETYTESEHKAHILAMLKLRNMDPALADDLPESGFMAFNDNEPIAAGFLRYMEGKHAMLDSYITNPQSSSYLRNAALDMVTDSLLKLAKFKGFTKLIAFSLYNSILDRAKAHGFKSIPHRMMVIDLGQ